MALTPIDESTDHVTECGQGQVDFCGLFQPDTSCLSLALPLGASQVDEVELAGLETLLVFDLEKKKQF